MLVELHWKDSAIDGTSSSSLKGYDILKLGAAFGKVGTSENILPLVRSLFK